MQDGWAQLHGHRAGGVDGLLQDGVRILRQRAHAADVLVAADGVELHPRRHQELLDVVVEDTSHALAVAQLDAAQPRGQGAELVGQALHLGGALGGRAVPGTR